MEKDITVDITVLIVDDHQMMCNGLREIINRQENMIVIGEAHNGEDAIKMVHKKAPDVIIMDVNLPVMNGIEATRKITALMPKAIVIGLSLHNNPEVIKNMRLAGASAYVTKNDAVDKLCATILKEVVLKKKSSEEKDENDNLTGPPAAN